jgi:hypothetical protein
VSAQDYRDFREEVLIAIADEQEPPGLGEVDLFDLCRRRQIPFQETWVHLLPRDLEDLGYGSDHSTMSARRFLINGAGLAAAAEAREVRRPKSAWDKVRSVPRSDWIALGAFIVSVIALLK